jgi:putative transposase
MPDTDAPDTRTAWPHAPVHRLTEHGIYFVTGATLHHAHHFRTRERLEVLHRGLLRVCTDFSWRLEAWAVFSNHYHFVAESPGTAESLSPMLATLHEKTSKWVNKLDATAERQVWHNYRETKLDFPNSYFARLAYVHQNAVKHGLVTAAKDYPWCSAAWFEENTPPAMVKTIYRFKTDRIEDDFAVDGEW